MKKVFFHKNKKSGFTIIETMIAVSVFVVVIMMGMGALLNANLLHQKSRDMRSIMDSLSFAMEEISRNLRTGYNYHCITNVNSLTNIDIVSDGQDCEGIAFEYQYGDTSDPDDQWIYEAVSDGTISFIRKSTMGAGTSAADWMQLTPDEVVIDSATFSIFGTEPGNGDRQQPFVIIRLSGKIKMSSKNIETPFSLQTSVSQRLIDI